MCAQTMTWNCEPAPMPCGTCTCIMPFAVWICIIIPAASPGGTWTSIACCGAIGCAITGCAITGCAITGCAIMGRAIIGAILGCTGWCTTTADG